MSSSLRVNTIVPSTGTNVAIGTANGTVTFTDSVNFVLGTGSSIFSPASNTLTFGTNDAERLRITSDGKIGINQASPEAMLQVDYDEGSSEVGLRLRAYNASGSKTWQLSEINGNGGVFTIRNATNSQNILNIDGVNQRVGVNNTSPDHKVSVFDAGYCGLELKSNRSTATDNIGGLHFKTQSTNVAYIQSLVDGTINFRNTSSLTERLRITSGGNIGIGENNPQNSLHISGSAPAIRFEDSGANGSAFSIIEDNNGLFKIRNDAGNSGTGSGIAFEVDAGERFRISSSGLAINKNAAADAEIEIVQSADPTLRLHDNRNAAYKADFLMAGSAPLIRNNNTSASDRTLSIQKGTTDHLVIEGSGSVRKPLQPAFSVRRNGNQGIPHQTNTKVQWNTEIFDVGGNFDSSTNYRFTAPVAGKYLFLGHLYVYSTYQVEAKIYKNGSIYKRFSGPLGTGSNDNPNGMDFMDIIDLSVNDFVEIFALHARTGDSSSVSIYGGNEKETSFVGYFLG